jgi:murein DD-endopeptidase MepM/ murein hydrolase activator NlpD
MAVLTSSPLSTAANNIVSLGTRSKGTLPRVQREFQDFSRFLDIRRSELEKIELPSQKKIKELSNLNIVNSFGSVGNLLSNLFSGALDIGNFISGFFPGKGEKIGKGPSQTKPQPKAQMRGGKLRLGGLRALGITNAIFSGLDFATGLAEGESVGKAGSGALGSLVGGFGGALAGSLLAGAIGQALIPVPGLGFVLGALGGAAGSFLGGYGADRAYEAVTGDTEQKQKEKLKQQEAKQKASVRKVEGGGGEAFGEVLTRFSQSVDKFEDFVINFGSVMGVETDYEGTDEGGGNIKPNLEATPYDGPVDGETFNPLPNGILSTAEVGYKGGEYGAERSYGGHSGQDIGGLPPGSPVVAWKTGKISYIGSVEPGDTILEIDHGGGVKSRYKHVVPTVPDGTIVYGGQQIAKLFATKAYAEHLHFEVWKNGSHVNPMPHIKAAQKLPGPLSPEKAKQHSEKSNTKANAQRQEVGVDIYPPPGSQQQSQSQIKPQPQSSPQTVTAPPDTQRTQPQAQMLPMPQSVMVAPPNQTPNIQSYPSYSQGQSYIMERQTIISSESPNSGSQRPVVVPVGGGGNGSTAQIIQIDGSQMLNSFMKNVLLTSLSSS